MAHFFGQFSNAIADLVGRPVTFVLAICLIIVWALTGPFLGYSENWQLVINTGTTIVTFLMMFVLQNTQNRDGHALQAKLDELILTNKNAENRFIGIERLDEKELEELRQAIDANVAPDGAKPYTSVRAGTLRK